VDEADLVAVKSGFGSGYMGEGSKGFSFVLSLLDAHRIPIEEYDVPREVLEKMDPSRLTMIDIDRLSTARPVRPTRWHSYVFFSDEQRQRDGTLLTEFEPAIPLGIIDPRITDLAISFWDGADERLLTGYRRLEDVVRKRTGIDEHGTKLFSQAFVGPTAKLAWKGIDPAEQIGRGQLFTAGYMAYRNPRAHREEAHDDAEYLMEFLLLNHLYRLESTSSDRSATES
jgi:hypothetical protein